MTLIFERSVVKESQQNCRCVLLGHCYQEQLVGRQVCFCVFWSSCKILVFAVVLAGRKPFVGHIVNVSFIEQSFDNVSNFCHVEDTIGVSRGL